MSARFVTQKLHAYIDYPVAMALIGMPFFLGLGSVNPLAFSLSVLTGVAAFVLTFLTDHETGVVRILPYKLHLAVDFVVGAAFVVAPFLLGFSGIEFWYYILNGAAVLIVVNLHKAEGETVSAA